MEVANKLEIPKKNMLRRNQLLQKNARYAELQVDDDIKKAFFVLQDATKLPRYKSMTGKVSFYKPRFINQYHTHSPHPRDKLQSCITTGRGQMRLLSSELEIFQGLINLMVSKLPSFWRAQKRYRNQITLQTCKVHTYEEFCSEKWKPPIMKFPFMIFRQ